MTSSKPQRRIRVLVAKPGLDGHDVGAKLVCRALVDAGMEVIYTGLRQSPEVIAKAALEEAVDAVGLSILSGAHLPLSKRVLEELESAGLKDVPVLVGGNVPHRDRAALEEMGIAKVFATGTPFDDIVSFLQETVQS
jgi:methylmalonyl-CoA mutase C-terminal domain/subunit